MEITFKEICQRVEIDEMRAIYWKALLKKSGLIEPRRLVGNKDVFSESDLQSFKRLRAVLASGSVASATEAIRQLKQTNAPPTML